MKKFSITQLLIPIDFSETSYLALEHAIFMARLFKAEIILLNVVEKNWENFSVLMPEIKVLEPSKLVDQLEQKLEEVADSIFEEHGIRCEALVTSGSICNEVVTIAADRDVSLIVMGTHGISGVEEFFLGSNAYKVVTRAQCPVMSVQAHAKKIGFSQIVLPIDNSDHSRQKVAQVAVLAKNYGSIINVIGILSENDDIVDENKLSIKINQIEAYFKAIDIVCNTKVVKGKNHAALTINYANELNADLIAIMTDQDDDGIFLSPYAQQIVNHSKIPVLSITPEEHPENIPWVHPY
ncbi:MAG: universal stress protein [Bacteroidetes bacterium]|nr:universal stress protein [Bacteroidota bacterium]